MSELINITGTISCTSEELPVLFRALPDHIALSLSEPGCLAFSITQQPGNECVFDVSEKFTDKAAFDTHTARTRASVWWERTQSFPRNIVVTSI